MSVKNMKRESKSSWKKLQTMQEEDIDYSDIPPLDESFFKNAKLRLPQQKSTITIRLDPKVLKWFKSRGKGYQTRINAILKMYVEMQKN